MKIMKNAVKMPTVSNSPIGDGENLKAEGGIKNNE